jgi:hypothetical protein
MHTYIQVHRTSDNFNNRKGIEYKWIMLIDSVEHNHRYLIHMSVTNVSKATPRYNMTIKVLLMQIMHTSSE